MRGPFCELMVKEVLPVLRAALARKLSEYGMSQKKIAEKMGTTQPAVSQYKKGSRGGKLSILQENTEVLERVEEIAKKLSTGAMSPEDLASEFCEICHELEGKKEFVERLQGKV